MLLPRNASGPDKTCFKSAERKRKVKLSGLKNLLVSFGILCEKKLLGDYRQKI